MHRTLFGNFEQPRFLGVVQIAGEFDLPVDLIERTYFRFTVAAVFGVFFLLADLAGPRLVFFFFFTGMISRL